MRRLASFFLLTFLLASLLPAAQGEGCRLCGKIGRCCCFLGLAAAPKAHCPMHASGGGVAGRGAAGSRARPDGRPTALRVPSVPNRREGAFQIFSACAPPILAGLMAAAGPHRPMLFQPPPPTPPPRSFQLV